MGGGDKTRVAFQVRQVSSPLNFGHFVQNFNKTAANDARNILSVRSFIRRATEHGVFSISVNVSVHPHMRP